MCIFNNMTEEQKANLYGQLLNEHTRLHNRINEIKGQSIDLNQKQLQDIKKLEFQQTDIMNKIRMLFNK